MTKKAKELNLYEILGVKKSATKKQIKDAYKKMAKKTHPDTEGGDEEKFKAVSEAYDILMDTNKRKHYDSTGETREESSQERIIMFLVQQIIPAIMTAEDVKTVDIIGNIQQYIEGQIEATFENEAHMKNNIQNISEFINRLKVKDSEDVENVFDEILKSQKRHMQKELASFPKERVFLAEVQVFIGKYEYIMDILQPFKLNIRNTNDNRTDKKVHLGHKST